MLNLCKNYIKKNSDLRKTLRKRFRVENFIVLLGISSKNYDT
jgi:hypothetical protein